MATIIMDGATQLVQLDSICVLPELEHTNPYRSENELTQLKDQIKSEGLVRDPLIIWPSKERGLVLVDGFSRLRICKQLRAETGGFGSVKAYFMDFSTLQEVKFWITVNQSNRRNLTDEQKAYYLGDLALALDATSKVKEFLKAISSAETDIPKGRSRDLIARHFNVSGPSLQRYEKFALGINRIRERNPSLAEAIMSGHNQDPKFQITQKIVQCIGNLSEDEYKRTSWKDAKGLTRFYTSAKTSSPAEQTSVPLKELKSLFSLVLKSPTEENFERVIIAMNQAKASLAGGKMKVA